MNAFEATAKACAGETAQNEGASRTVFVSELRLRFTKIPRAAQAASIFDSYGATEVVPWRRVKQGLMPR